MKRLVTYINEVEFEKFCQQCEKLQESHYEFVKKAVKERMRELTIAEKANLILWGKPTS